MAFVNNREQALPLRRPPDGCETMYAICNGQGAEYMSTVAQALIRGLGTP
jgi:hypothetical protein